MKNSAAEALKKGMIFKKNELILSLGVFLYLAVSHVSLSATVLGGNAFLLLYFFFLLAENYVTTAVYCGMKDSIIKGRFSPVGILRKGKYFFARILLYKALAGLAVLLCMGFALGMIEMVNTSSPFKAGTVMAITVVWLAFPAYILALTLFTPVLIIFEDFPVMPAVKESILFTRRTLPQVLLLSLLFLPPWIFAFFLLRVYNDTGFLLLAAILYFVALLEIITVKAFMVFYCKGRHSYRGNLNS